MSVKNISAKELKKMLDEGSDNVEIIDVRDPDELEIIKFTKYKLIPMSILTVKINEVDWNKKVVLICRSGARSSIVAQAVAASTGHEIYNLQHGIAEVYKEGFIEHLEVDEDLVGRYF